MICRVECEATVDADGVTRRGKSVDEASSVANRCDKPEGHAQLDLAMAGRRFSKPPM